MGKYKSTTTCISLILLFASGKCQFSGLSGMSSMFGGMNPMMSSMGSGMFGSMNPSMMSAMGGLGGMGGMGGMGSFGSGMMSSMMPNMVMGNAMNDPLMTLAMGTIELGGSDLMILNNLVKTIVGPEATVNPGLMVLYSSDGGLPINAAKMIPYITIMQGMAKDLKVRVPGVQGEASKEQIENLIFQRALQWMQSRNMAGAFVENAGLFLMSNAFNNAGSQSPFSSSGTSATSSIDANNAAATARASATARAALAKFVASQNNNTAAKPVVPAASTSKAPTLPNAADTQSNLLAKIMSGAMSQSGSSSLSLPSGMTLPGGMSFPSSGLTMPGSSTEGTGSNSGGVNPAMMAMGGMEMFGF